MWIDNINLLTVLALCIGNYQPEQKYYLGNTFFEGWHVSICPMLVQLISFLLYRPSFADHYLFNSKYSPPTLTPPPQAGYLQNTRPSSLRDRTILFVVFVGNVWISFLGVKMYAESKFASLSHITWSVFT